MKRQVAHDVLRRMVSPPPPAPEDVPITSSRAIKMAVTKAADVAHGMPITVTALREEVLDLADCLNRFAETSMLIGLSRDADLVGLCGVDLGLRAALIEVQTVGVVLPTNPDDRPSTKTDVVMADPFLKTVLSQLQITAVQTPLDGWSDDVVPSGQVSNTRAAGLVLAEVEYRVIQLSIDLHAEGRSGEIVLALPDKRFVAPLQQTNGDEFDWDVTFQAAVNGAKVPLTAELHRMVLPIFAVESLAVGQVLSLAGCQVTSVKLRAGDGRAIATARLGQSGGNRAIRIEQAIATDMVDLPGLSDGANSTPETGLLSHPDIEVGVSMADGDGISDIASAVSDGDPDDFAVDISAADDADFEMPIDADESAGGMPEAEATEAQGGAFGEDELAWDLSDTDPTAETPTLDWSSEGLTSSVDD